MVSANGTALLAIQGNVAGQNHVHTLAFRNGNSLNQSLQSLIDAWQAGCRTQYRALFRTDDTPIQIIRAYHVCGSLPLDATTEEADVAGGTKDPIAEALGEKVAPWLAQVFSVRTASAGRSRRGRFFIGGLSEGNVSGGSVVGDRVGGGGGGYRDALITTFGAAGNNAPGWRLVVHSRKLAAVPGTQCQDSSTPVTAILVRTELARMTSRKAGSGT